MDVNVDLERCHQNDLNYFLLLFSLSSTPAEDQVLKALVFLIVPYVSSGR